MNPQEDMFLDDGTVYLNHAAIGPLPKNAILPLTHNYTSMSRLGSKAIDIDTLEMTWDNLRKNFANLINGDPAGVTITTNTASGLHIVADSIQPLLEEHSNIVLPELEFTTNSYVWQKLCSRYDIELRIVKFNDVSMTLQGWEESIDDNTVLVALSHVQFSNGYRADLEYITNLAHDHEAKICIDAIQSLGVVPLDVKRIDADFVAAGGYKWLLGPHGTGFFYIKPELIEEHNSILVGMFSDENYKEFTHHPYNPWNDARRYQITLSPMHKALNESIKVINKWDPKDNFKHVLQLQNRIIDNIEGNKDFTICSNMEPKHRSGIISFDHENAKQVVDKLSKDNIIVSEREGSIRISPHRYNTLEEVDVLTDKLEHYSSG